MMDTMRVVIADDESIRLMSLKAQLEALGLQVVGEALNGRQAVDLVIRLKPDLAILDIKMPEMDGLEAAKQIAAQYPIPVIVVTAYSERTLAERAIEAGVFSYLMKPISEEDLLPAILLAKSRFREFQDLTKGISDLKEALETRKLIERAKGILMERRNLSEAEAFRRMQIQSQNENKKLAEIAQAIIMADRML
ncbi:MAG: ANTAR domain-containing response regulator [Chloroflexota bacterium]|jgi:AmiR/NasT family two-component response regulator